MEVSKNPKKMKHIAFNNFLDTTPFLDDSIGKDKNITCDQDTGKCMYLLFVLFRKAHSLMMNEVFIIIEQYFY